MTIPVGYDPERLRALDRHTRRALDDLHSLHSGDPAAAAAIRSIRATRRMLDDHWMPLLAALRTSQMMIDWTRAALGNGSVMAPSCTPRSTLRDDELISALFAQNRRWSPGRHDQGRLGHGDPAALAMLTSEIEARVRDDDPAFAALLVDTAGDLDVLLLVLAHGTFPSSLIADAVRSAVDRPGGVGANHLRRAHLVDELLARLADAPQVALDLLLDADVAERVLAFDRGVEIWFDRPATPGVAAVLHAAMVEAPAARPARRAEGFELFSRFIDEANDLPVDRDGFSAGVARGLAASMLHYVPTFVHSISGDESTGALPDSSIHADRTGDGLDDRLSGYEAMTDFFGALLVDADAVAHLGVVLAAMADDVAYQRTTLSEAAHFAGLLRDAVLNERHEAALAAAARRAQRAQIVSTLSAAAKLATGAGPAAKAVFDATTRFVTNIADTSGSSGRDGRTLDPGSLTRHLVQMSVIRRLSTDGDHRRDLGIRTPLSAWREVAQQLDALDQATADGASDETVRTARQRIFNRVRRLGGGAAIDRLDEHGTLAGLPDRDVLGD